MKEEFWKEEFKKEDYVKYIKTKCINCNNSLPGTWEYYKIYGNFCRDCNVKCCTSNKKGKKDISGSGARQACGLKSRRGRPRKALKKE